MAQLGISKKALEPPAALPAGIHELMFGGFEPKLSKKKEGKEQSLNLNPKLSVINNPNPELNGKRHFENLNINAAWIIKDFLHAFGIQFDDGGGDEVTIPGEFVGGNPQTFEGSTYNGPLLGQTAQVEIIQVEAQDQFGNKKNGEYRSVTKRYICKVPGCQEKHSENLAKA